jgi:AcrR family transcriptional regulator
MPRPRVHDLDQVLDTAERLVAEQGPERLTVRSLAEAAGVSNGAIYHGFGSLRSLLGQVWLRAATDFLRLQTELVDAALSNEPQVGAEAAAGAVVAAAETPALFADQRPDAARMLLTVRREQLLGPEMPSDVADALIDLDKQLLSLLIRLAQLTWDRRDGQAVAVITTCVVDLPTAFFRREITSPAVSGTTAITTDTRDRLAAAVRAVLALPPPSPKKHHAYSGKC